MLRIQEGSDGCATTLSLSGRIQAEHIACIRLAMSDGCGRRILDLGEITLVDLEVVRFLIRCADEGMELLNTPAYVREWMNRERAEERDRI